MLLGVFSSPLGWHVGRGAFEHLQQGLLHPLARDVAGDGDVEGGLADLVDLVDVEDAPLGGSHVPVCSLDETKDEVLHVFAHVAGLGECGGVTDGEGDFEDAGQGLGQEGLAAARRADEQDVALFRLQIVAEGVVLEAEPLVVVVHRNREDLLGPFLTDDVLVQFFLELDGRRHFGHGEGGQAAPKVLLDKGVAQFDTLPTDKDPGRTGHQRTDLRVGLSAEGAGFLACRLLWLSWAHISVRFPASGPTVTCADPCLQDISIVPHPSSASIRNSLPDGRRVCG